MTADARVGRRSTATGTFGTAAIRRRLAASRDFGPFDAEDLDPTVVDPGLLDFGSIRVPVPPEGSVTVEPTANGRLQAVHIALPGGRLSVSALAAPKSSGLWADLVSEIDSSLREGGARVRSFQGDWGRELHAQTGAALSVFVGVDGARWMLYGVATGPERHAGDLDAALRQMLKGTVVDRGRSPFPVRTVLPLTVPEELADADVVDDSALGVPGPPPPQDGSPRHDDAPGYDDPLVEGAGSGPVRAPQGRPAGPPAHLPPTHLPPAGPGRSGPPPGGDRPGGAPVPVRAPAPVVPRRIDAPTVVRPAVARPAAARSVPPAHQQPPVRPAAAAWSGASDPRGRDPLGAGPSSGGSWAEETRYTEAWSPRNLEPRNLEPRQPEPSPYDPPSYDSPSYGPTPVRSTADPTQALPAGRRDRPRDRPSETPVPLWAAPAGQPDDGLGSDPTTALGLDPTGDRPADRYPVADNAETEWWRPALDRPAADPRAADRHDDRLDDHRSDIAPTEIRPLRHDPPRHDPEPSSEPWSAADPWAAGTSLHDDLSAPAAPHRPGYSGARDPGFDDSGHLGGHIDAPGYDDPLRPDPFRPGALRPEPPSRPADDPAATQWWPALPPESPAAGPVADPYEDPTRHGRPRDEQLGDRYGYGDRSPSLPPPEVPRTGRRRRAEDTGTGPTAEATLDLAALVRERPGRRRSRYEPETPAPEPSAAPWESGDHTARRPDDPRPSGRRRAPEDGVTDPLPRVTGSTADDGGAARPRRRRSVDVPPDPDWVPPSARGTAAHDPGPGRHSRPR